MTSASEGYSPVSIANETRISRPENLESFPVSWSDWDFVRSRIERCQVRIDVWGYLTSFFFSTVIFALSAALISNINSASETLRVFYYTISVSASILTLLCLYARLNLGHAQHQRIQSVLEDMYQIEHRYERPSS